MQLAQLLLQGFQLAAVVLLLQRFALQLHLRQQRRCHQREGIRQQRHRFGLVLQRHMDALYQRFQRLQFRPFRVGGVQNVPGRGGGVGQRQRVVEHLAAFLVVRVLPQVKVRCPPRGIPVGPQRLQTALLLLPVDVQEKLHHQIAVVGELTFKALDALQTGVIVLLVQLSAEKFRGGLLDPAAVIKRKAADSRNVLHKAV